MMSLSVARPRRRILRMLLASATFLLGGCHQELSPPSTEKSDVTDGTVPDERRNIVLAVHPYASTVELTSQFTPLIEYLSESLDRTFALSVAESYEAHIARVGADEVDVALMGPAPYVEMTSRFGGKKLLCCFEIDGARSFRGHVVVRKDSPATSFEDLRDKTFASSSRASTMGYLLPRYMFIRAGTPFPEGHLLLVGSHNNVCLNVLSGDADAGGVREKVYQKYKERGLKIIATTPRVTAHPFVATNRLDAETSARVREALLAIRGQDQVERLLEPLKDTLTGLAPVEDKAYDSLRTMAAAVRKDEQHAPKLGEEAE